MLAAGQSTRTGTPKPLIKIKGQYWVETQFEKLKQLKDPYVVFVLGFHREQILEQVPALRAHYVVNEHPENGQFSSIQAGLLPLYSRDWAGAFVLPVDVPAPAPKVWEFLVSQLKPEVAAVIPTYKGRGGHPVLLSRDLCSKILDADPMTSRLDDILHKTKGVLRVEVDDERIVKNLNFSEDYSKDLV